VTASRSRGAGSVARPPCRGNGREKGLPQTSPASAFFQRAVRHLFSDLALLRQSVASPNAHALTRRTRVQVRPQPRRGSFYVRRSRLAPFIDLAPWQLATRVANSLKPPRVRQSLYRCRVVLRVHALIEAVVLHSDVFARLFNSHRAIAAAHREAEGLCPIVDVAQLAYMQPGIAPADVPPDP
jgi:hypothetical protein